MSFISKISRFIEATVGNQRDNIPDDIIRVKNALDHLGYFNFTQEPEPNGYITREMDESIKRYQKDKGLKVDGWMRPKGETESSLLKDLMRPVSDDIEVEELPPSNIPGTKIPDEGIPEGYVTPKWDEYKLHQWREKIDKGMERQAPLVDSDILFKSDSDKQKMLRKIIKVIKR